jgi:glycerophosphoryl diester phosphodiesterase
MRLIAHRGFDAQYSANTVAAVEQAIPAADMVELDIRRCASGELVVAHNDLVNIDIDGVDQVDELTASELADLNDRLRQFPPAREAIHWTNGTLSLPTWPV